MNKSFLYTAITIASSLFILGCEDDIFPSLDQTDPQVVVDAWITNKPETQRIYLSTTLPYFEAEQPPVVTGATVSIIDNDGKVFGFIENEPGIYEWIPNATDTVFGTIGNSYTLNIITDTLTISAVSTLNRVPIVDSVTFEFEEEDSFFPEGYYGEFFARDPIGPGDTYWIKSFKNGNYLNKPEELNIAFDAGFSEGGNIDGLIFIPPIRDAVNPFDLDEDDEIIVPYIPGDSLYVEIHSISNDAFFFLNELGIQTNRPGGFGEFFAVPLANLPSNIQSNSERSVLGFFNVAAVSGLGARVEE